MQSPGDVKLEPKALLLRVLLTNRYSNYVSTRTEKQAKKKTLNIALDWLMVLRMLKRGKEWSDGPCEHASTAPRLIYFASTSSDQVCLASREHFRKYNWRARAVKVRVMFF